MWSSDYRTHLTSDRAASIKHYLKSANIVSIDTFQEQLGSRKFDSSEKTLINGDTKVNFDLARGGSVKSAIYKGKKYFGWVPHGAYNKLDLAFDYFSLHSVIEPLGERKVTSLSPVDIIQDLSVNEIVFGTKVSNYVFKKKIEVQNNGLSVTKSIHFPTRRKEIIHPFIFTFTSESFDLSSLYYESSNGGLGRKRRYLRRDLDMTEGYSHLITSIYSLGNTDGVIEIGDVKKSLSFKVDMLRSALLPKIKFVKTSDSFLLRLIYSAQEVDDTFVENNGPWMLECNVVIEFS
jgi:hypothetical protein